jgi:hypothetical protein
MERIGKRKRKEENRVRRGEVVGREERKIKRRK